MVATLFLSPLFYVFVSFSSESLSGRIFVQDSLESGLVTCCARTKLWVNQKYFSTLFGLTLREKEYLFVSVCVYFLCSFANSFVQVIIVFKMQYC